MSRKIRGERQPDGGAGEADQQCNIEHDVEHKVLGDGGGDGENGGPRGDADIRRIRRGGHHLGVQELRFPRDQEEVAGYPEEIRRLAREHHHSQGEAAPQRRLRWGG